MRYKTTTTLNAHLDSSENVIIYIPQGEEIETSPETTGSSLTVRVLWRGQLLHTEQRELTSTTIPAKSGDDSCPVTPHGHANLR